jgi:hypothetical protein
MKYILSQQKRTKGVDSPALFGWHLPYRTYRMMAEFQALRPLFLRAIRFKSSVTMTFSEVSGVWTGTVVTMSSTSLQNAIASSSHRLMYSATAVAVT